MNWERAKQSWRHIDMHARSTWPKLSDDELADIAGNREALVEKLREHYGVVESEAAREADAWVARLGLSGSTPPEDDRAFTEPTDAPSVPLPGEDRA